MDAFESKEEKNTWVFPKIGVGPPNHPMFNRVFHYFHHPFCGTNIFGNIHMLEIWKQKKSVETPICSEMFIFVVLKNIDLQKIS